MRSSFTRIQQPGAAPKGKTAKNSTLNPYSTLLFKPEEIYSDPEMRREQFSGDMMQEHAEPYLL